MGYPSGKPSDKPHTSIVQPMVGGRPLLLGLNGRVCYTMTTIKYTTTTTTTTIRKVLTMAGKCTDCGTTQEGNIVYSGTDAFVLGVIDLVERICYDCANKRAKALRD